MEQDSQLRLFVHEGCRADFSIYRDHLTAYENMLAELKACEPYEPDLYEDREEHEKEIAEQAQGLISAWKKEGYVPDRDAVIVTQLHIPPELGSMGLTIDKEKIRKQGETLIVPFYFNYEGFLTFSQSEGYHFEYIPHGSAARIEFTLDTLQQEMHDKRRLDEGELLKSANEAFETGRPELGKRIIGRLFGRDL